MPPGGYDAAGRDGANVAWSSALGAAVGWSEGKALAAARIRP